MISETSFSLTPNDNSKFQTHQPTSGCSNNQIDDFTKNANISAVSAKMNTTDGGNNPEMQQIYEQSDATEGNEDDGQ